MAALFQTALMRLALCGLAVSLALLTLRSRMARDTFARLLSIWRSLTAFGRVAICSFLLVGVLVGGDKTNGVNNLPPQMMSPMAQQGHGFLLTGLWTGTFAVRGRIRFGWTLKTAGYSLGARTTFPAWRSFPTVRSGQRHLTQTPSPLLAHHSRSCPGSRHLHTSLRRPTPTALHGLTPPSTATPTISSLPRLNFSATAMCQPRQTESRRFCRASFRFRMPASGRTRNG